MSKEPTNSQCHACGTSLEQYSTLQERNPRFCPHCGAALVGRDETTVELAPSERGTNQPTLQVSLKDEIAPQDDQVLFSIGRYKILERIGKGGMGEVFLAFDPVCGRRVALKRIRSDLQTHRRLHSRFLRESRITAQLMHPTIIPIYSIHSEDQLIYYSMPFVEGKTLKQILRETRRREREGLDPEPTGSSIPALARVFLSICQAVAYAHSRGVLHRDLKPENVIVGRYGQITILDWGLAKLLEDPDETEPLVEGSESVPGDLTIPGKIVGTISHMAPERAKEAPASVQTDIYALGSVLFQALTLRLPFRRPSLKEFQANVDNEVLPDPSQTAPYRDIPQLLGRVVKKALAPDPADRYQTVDALIHDVESYLEGRSEWFRMAQLNVTRSDDWEFQENVLLSEHAAIARHADVTSWVSLMVSKLSFPENTRIEARVRVGESGNGMGFLLSVPENSQRTDLGEGYCLWLGTDKDPTCQLYRNNVEVLHTPHCYLHRGEWHQITIEKIDSKITFYLNGAQQFSYTSHLPLTGTHVGLLTHDADFEISDFNVAMGSMSIKVSRLAVPDALLTARQYEQALTEYRRIGQSFPGRAEGREAMFRAGVALLEWGRRTDDPSKFDPALDEFEKLHYTPAAPLEYLGKSLVYKALGDANEEINCLELGYRRYKNHPMVSVLEEQILYRMHDSSRLDRHATYRFTLLANQLIPNVANSPNSKRLAKSLNTHWETLPFIEPPASSKEDFSIQLAFWLAKPHTIKETIETVVSMKSPHITTLGNGIFSLIELGATKVAKEVIRIINTELDNGSTRSLVKTFNPLLGKPQPDWIPHSWDIRHRRILWHMLEEIRRSGDAEELCRRCEALKRNSPPREISPRLDSYTIWGLLLKGDTEEAGKLLKQYPSETMDKENHRLHFLYGCYLAATEGDPAAHTHFAAPASFAHPRTAALLGNFVAGRISLVGEWYDNAFSWEKRQLYAQLSLWHHCRGMSKESVRFRDMERDEIL
jgi:serine/threonine protein kinase/tetratricopeptide (TPR) repeat protein/predicted RNA-binding Zn-ribbon protein involved in translation (DUF1610 family)